MIRLPAFIKHPHFTISGIEKAEGKNSYLPLMKSWVPREYGYSTKEKLLGKTIVPKQY